MAHPHAQGDPKVSKQAGRRVYRRKNVLLCLHCYSDLLQKGPKRSRIFPWIDKKLTSSRIIHVPIFPVKLYLCARARVRDVEVKTESELIAGCKLQSIHFPAAFVSLENFCPPKGACSNLFCFAASFPVAF